MRRLAPLAAVAGLAALAGPAAADVRFEGRTSQGQRALLVAEDNGVPKRGAIRWRARCRGGGVTVLQGSVFNRPLDFATRRRIRDSGAYLTRRYQGGIRLRVVARVRGRKVGARRWVGRFSARAVARRGGVVIDRCVVRGVRWSVRR